MSMNRKWMIYGATGYTGGLIVEEALQRGHSPVLAGRDGAALRVLAERSGLRHAVFPLDDDEAAAKELIDVDAVLHCAGPFIRTSSSMVRACLRSRTNYLDITGEIPVFETIMALRDEAVSAGVALLPGVGFDVVPTDCLAALLAEAVPGADNLALAFYARGGGVSRGTLKTMIENLPHVGAIRKQGQIVEVPFAWHVREIPFSCGSRWASTIPWGDVSTAFHTTGITNIRVYSASPRRNIRIMSALSPLLPMLGKRPVKRLLQRLIRRDGPGREENENGRMYVWGSVTDPAGNEVSATLETPEAYRFTAMTAVRSVERLLRGDVTPGSWTPARAFGASYVTEFPGVVLNAPHTASLPRV